MNIFEAHMLVLLTGCYNLL